MNSQFANPVFVVGIFRSGTSLLYSLLNQHPQMALMYECNAWDFPELLSPLRQNGWLERQEFYNHALSRHRLVFGGSLRGLENVRTPEELYRVFGNVKGAKLWGEKSPLYSARLRQLARRYPGGSFILLWRNPEEIYRSVVDAGRTSHFFRRRGMLNRFIFCQEQMIRQAAELNRTGIRLHHVNYAELVEKTEDVCRGICRFLKIEFDKKMLDLVHADLSAVYRAPQHDHLRRGIIARRHLSESGTDPRVIQKLQRFGNRWHRLQSKWFNGRNHSSTVPEPSLAERLYHKMLGAFLNAMDGGKRAAFEFLPLPWLRTYRQAKKWFWDMRVELPTDQLPLRQQFAANKITLLTAGVILAAIAVIDYLTGPHVTLLPFYMIPCAIPTLILNRRWGTFAAVITTMTWAGLQTLDSPTMNFAHCGLFMWDTVMRFIVLQTVVLMLDRMRIEIAS
ncbi:MAG TPA: sulfotransferase, partial [Candidatus Dormibacteraeota bacterium]|nr:sulfotransferase [Candidatus Dormibacteraeota bacterium]